MKTYPTYKDSGVDWLGKIPKDWQAIKMKYLFRDVSIKGKPEEELLSVTQNRGVIPRDWIEERSVMPSGNLDSFKFIAKGDFAISLRSFQGGLEYCFHDGIISPAYTVLKKWKQNTQDNYFKYLFKSISFISELQTSVVGIRQGKNISFSQLSYSLMPLPPKQEQQAIANFLDDTCGKLDTVVAQKEKMITFLKERKQALIQNAVTRGLNENVPMKNSGVDWIGKIPENWEVKRLKFVSEIRNDKLYARESKLPYLGMENVESWSGKLIETESESEGLANVYKSGDVLFGKLRPYLAKVYLADHDGLCSSEFLPFISSDNLTNKFLKNIILSFRFINQIDSSTYGSKMPRANPDYIKNTLIPIPPKEEQEKIVNYIDAQSEKINQAVKQQEQAIIKLKEYKASLIDSCVLGKIKVS
ncbi:restriction endonuclease subunit S [Salegentibacter maritimus]|uniref:Restriction endonuclease subunit S n=1 Tax=Salegentibacter maritimus TaxID=2794347 RepID=A0ABS0TDN1_9FLAO|nr:restriction endonuclease subunit S [Salegentibacter maritimus]MBI6119145.1 restriction endonuclease subunit S [Salegentibacter maritimus]